MLNIAIVDDEARISEKLKGFVTQFFAEEQLEVPTAYTVDRYADGMAFLAAQYGKYDIVFMDIKMPMKNGLEIATEFRKKNETACLIFVTNLADMAIKGYEVSALDFVVKPIEYGDFKYRMAKAVKRAKANVKESIVVRVDRENVKIDVSSILYVEQVLHKVVYHTITGEQEVWGTMRDTEQMLKPYGFSRCNSGFLVNLRYIDAVRGNCVHIGDTVLTVSRGKKAEFTATMTNYLGGVHKHD